MKLHLEFLIDLMKAVLFEDKSSYCWQTDYPNLAFWLYITGTYIFWTGRSNIAYYSHRFQTILLQKIAVHFRERKIIPVSFVIICELRTCECKSLFFDFMIPIDVIFEIRLKRPYVKHPIIIIISYNYVSIIYNLVYMLNFR
jgi:hypothetical protein